MENNANNNPEGRLPAAKYNEPNVNQLVTEAHANYGRVKDLTGSKRSITAVSLAMTASFLLAMGFSSVMSDVRSSVIDDQKAEIAHYRSQGDASRLNQYLDALGNAAKKAKPEALMTWQQAVNQTKKALAYLDDGNEEAAKSMDRILIEGLGSDIGIQGDLSVINIAPSYDRDGEILGYLVSGVVSREGEAVPYLVAVDDDYKLHTLFDLDARRYLGAPNDSKVSYKTVRHYLSGISQSTPVTDTIKMIVDKGDNIRSRIKTKLSSPADNNAAMPVILKYMDEHNGAFHPQLEKEMVTLDQFERDGFASRKTRDYSQAKILETRADEYVILSTALGKKGAIPMAGVIKRDGGKFQYYNIDLNPVPGSRATWALLDNFPVLTPTQAQAYIQRLTNTNNNNKRG